MAHTHLMQVGKQFDALLVDTQAPDASNPVFFTFQQDTMAVNLFANPFSYPLMMMTYRAKTNFLISKIREKIITCDSIVHLFVSVVVQHLCLDFFICFITGHH